MGSEAPSLAGLLQFTHLLFKKDQAEEEAIATALVALLETANLVSRP